MTGYVSTQPREQPMLFRLRYRAISMLVMLGSLSAIPPAPRGGAGAAVRADSAVTYRSAKVDGIDFLSRGGRGGYSGCPVAAWLSNFVAHVPQPDSGAGASLPRDRARLSGVRS